MSEKNKAAEDNSRRYPEIYEKVIPVAIAVIVVLVVGMLVLTVGIATGLISAG